MSTVPPSSPLPASSMAEWLQTTRELMSCPTKENERRLLDMTQVSNPELQELVEKMRKACMGKISYDAPISAIESLLKQLGKTITGNEPVIATVTPEIRSDSTSSVLSERFSPPRMNFSSLMSSLSPVPRIRPQPFYASLRGDSVGDLQLEVASPQRNTTPVENADLSNPLDNSVDEDAVDGILLGCLDSPLPRLQEKDEENINPSDLP